MKSCRKTIGIIILSVVCIAMVSIGAPAFADSTSITKDLWATDLARPLENRAFGPGEKLVFTLEFGAVTAGTGILEILPFAKIDAHKCYQFRAEAKSAKGFDYIYKVRDRIDSFVDSVMFVSHRFTKRLREGNYKDDKLVDYEHNTRKATMIQAGSDNKITDFDTLAVDILSSMYMLRLMPLEVGKPVHIPVHDVDKKYPLMVEIQKKERVSVPAGKFDCVKVEPKLESEGIFKRKGRIWVWLTDDEKHMPVMMATELPFGTIKGSLIEYKLGEPTGSKKPESK